jgi:hypothetical protein
MMPELLERSQARKNRGPDGLPVAAVVSIVDLDNNRRQ